MQYPLDWTFYARRRFWPLDTPNLIADYDASVGITIATGVSQWNDQSGQANNIAEATAGQQPALTAAAVNGFPAVTLDGVDDRFTSITFNNAKTTGPGGTYFFVMKANALFASGTHDFLFVSAAADGINPGVQITNSNYSLIAGGSLNAGETMSTSAYRCYTFQHNTGSNGVIRRNGTQLIAGSDGNSATGGNGFTLGALSGGTRSVSASIARVLIYDRAISADEMKTMEQFLSWRYALGF